MSPRAEGAPCGRVLGTGRWWREAEAVVPRGRGHGAAASADAGSLQALQGGPRSPLVSLLLALLLCAPRPRASGVAPALPMIRSPGGELGLAGQPACVFWGGMGFSASVSPHGAQNCAPAISNVSDQSMGSSRETSWVRGSVGPCGRGRVRQPVRAPVPPPVKQRSGTPAWQRDEN